MKRDGELILVWLCIGLLAASNIMLCRVIRQIQYDVEFRKIVAHAAESEGSD